MLEVQPDLRLARQVAERLEALGRVSDEPGRLTRVFGSPAMKRVNALVQQWMREAGMETQEDAVGNVRGLYRAGRPGAKTLVLGSHLDTVRDAGKFDGPLGVLTAIASIQQLRETGVKPPFAIEVIGFADEEGVRFQSTYLGSKAVAGQVTPPDLQLKDGAGVTLAQAIRDFGANPDRLETARLDRDALLGYVEVHIEQGPVLERSGLALGVVSAIVGQARVRITFTGKAGHAGTTPMNLRQDALCAAAEFLVETERFARSQPPLTATVGQIEARPGASNVIPGEARLTLDLRHPEDQKQNQALAELEARARAGAAARGVKLDWELVQSVGAVRCDARLSGLLAETVKRIQGRSIELASGAGHDAVVMSSIAPVAMMFVRCKGGLSHHPDEFVSVEDMGLAVAALSEFVRTFASETKQVGE